MVPNPTRRDVLRAGVIIGASLLCVSCSSSPQSAAARAGVDQLTRFRPALESAHAGLGVCRIGCAGDSITEGFGGGNGTGRPNLVSYPAALSSLLESCGFPRGGSGWVPPWRNRAAAIDTQWRYQVGPWSPASAANSPVVNGSGATITFVSDSVGDVAEFSYLDNGGPFTYAVDSAGTRMVRTAGSGSLVKVTVSNLPVTSHTIAITAPPEVRVSIGPAQVRRSSGVLVSNLGVGSSTTSPWRTDAPVAQNGPVMRALDEYDLVLLEAMIVNDAVRAVDPAQTTANLTETTAAHKGAGSNVLMIVPMTPSPIEIDPARWAAQRNAAYQAAEDQAVPLLDIGLRWGSWDAANGRGLMFGAYHGTTTGYADIAQAVAETVRA